MKILSLHFKNLNSLKGEFKIDFTNPKLANAGLFAITGPTGAGKSTLLDAITLALYSYTPRLGDITDSTIPEKGVIVTKHTREAFSHIEFEVSGQKYKAEWAISKNRNENWNKITHKLNIYEVDQFVTIKDKNKEKEAEVERITGLTKEQFTKAIVLSQGKFDEFLKSKKDDRYALLEVITGSGIYRKIGQKVFETLRLKSLELDSLEKQKGDITLLTADELHASKLEKDALGVEVNDLKTELILLNNLSQTKQNIKRLINEKSAIQSDFLDLQNREKAFEPSLAKLEEHEKVLPLQVAYNKWLSATDEIKKLNAQLIELNNKQDRFLNEKDQLIQGLSLLLKVEVDEYNFKYQLDEFVRQVDSLDKKKDKINATLLVKKEGLATFFKQIPNQSLPSIQSFAESPTQLKEFVNNNDAILSSQPLLATLDINKIALMIDEFNARLQLCKEAIRYKNDGLQLIELKKNRESNLSDLQNKIDQQVVDLELLTNSIISKKGDLEIVKRACEANAAYVNLDLQRSKLVEGEPCPCCGSINHPYSHSKPRLNDEMANQLKLIQNEVDEMLMNERSIRDSFSATKSTIESLQSLVADTNKKLEDNKKLFDGVIDQLNLSPEIAADDLLILEEETEKSIQYLRAYQSWNETRKPLVLYIDKLDEYISENSQLNEVILKRKELFPDNSIGDYNSKQILNWSNINKDILATAETIEVIKTKIDQSESEFKDLDGKLKESVSLLSFTSIDSLGSLLLSEQQVDEYKHKKAALVNERISLITKMEEVNKKYSFEVDKDDPSVDYDILLHLISEKNFTRDAKNNKIGAISTRIQLDDENKAKYAAIEKQIQDLKNDRTYYKTISELIGDKDGDKFNNIIQRITLRHLFKMTNDRLAVIMDRYQVDLGSDKYEDQIWVIDTYMGDERRIIDSVSGGERFVISLAMALSLSDLASNNVKIDSVFIDEGFGSLSPEELDNAISMLERLQVENEKTIGIISHVESLKERISTQIVIQKLQNGESTIFLKSNGSLLSLAT